MSIQFKEECNYIKEVAMFAYRYYDQDAIVELHDTLKKKSGYTKEVQNILEVMEKVYIELCKKLSMPPNLSYYFVNFNNKQESVIGCLADSILLKFYCSSSKDMNTLKQESKDAFHQNQGMSFMRHLQSSYFEIEEEEEKILEESEFIKFLDGDTIPMEMKWNIYKIYKNYDFHVDELWAFIEQSIPVFKEVYKKYESTFIDFNTFWKEAEKEGTLAEKITAVSGLKLDFNNMEATLCPSWMGCNMITLYGEKSWDDIYIMIGLFFKDYNFFDDAQISDKEMCARLKLLSDPSKYEILKLIKEEGKYGAQLAQHLNLTTATISHHVSSLVNSGLVTIEKNANRIYYHLNKPLFGRSIDQLRKDLYEK